MAHTQSDLRDAAPNLTHTACLMFSPAIIITLTITLTGANHKPRRDSKFENHIAIMWRASSSQKLPTSGAGQRAQVSLELTLRPRTPVRHSCPFYVLARADHSTQVWFAQTSKIPRLFFSSRLLYNLNLYQNISISRTFANLTEISIRAPRLNRPKNRGKIIGASQIKHTAHLQKYIAISRGLPLFRP
jgi:hypothetical protein